MDFARGWRKLGGPALVLIAVAAFAYASVKTEARLESTYAVQLPIE
jgi:hypothetical protein